jgi:hypothetical protein
MKHNKKRNIGIMYELLLMNISSNLVEGSKGKANKSLRIIEKRFNNKTELYKEFRLFNALIKTHTSSERVALQIINEAKDAVRRYDKEKIDREKSRLIRDINYIVNDSSFYHRKVENYRAYGTVQQLFNEWAKGDQSNLKLVLDLEDKVIRMLLEEKVESNKTEIDPNLTDKLVVNLMTEKLNSRYSSNLNEEQKQIVQKYSLYCTENHHGDMRKYLSQLKESTVNAMRNYKVETDSEFTRSKIDNVISKVNQLNTGAINDDLVSKFMVVSNLKEQILKEDK